jgi:hypothetical protein
MWLFQKKPFLQQDYEKIKEECYGFLYKITAFAEGKYTYYWGRKAFTHTKRSKLSKKARVGTRKRIKVEKIDSKWEVYKGSSKPLLKYLDENPEALLIKEIVLFCKTRSDLTYRETELLIDEDVLFRDDCWNGSVGGKWYRGKINPL